MPKLKNFKYLAIESIGLSRFEASFRTSHMLTSIEESLLTESLMSVNATHVEFSLQNVKNKLQPLTALIKLIDKCFDIDIDVLSVEGDKLGTFTMKNVQIDKMCPSNMDFSYNSSDTLNSVQALIKFTDLEFNGEIIMADMNN